MLKTNIGGVERVVRVVAGAGIVSMAFVGPESPWAFLGLVPLLTGVAGWCPPYAMLGLNTCGKCR